MSLLASRPLTVAGRYAVAITPVMRALIEAPDDPIARQFVPSTEELTVAPHEHKRLN